VNVVAVVVDFVPLALGSSFIKKYQKLNSVSLRCEYYLTGVSHFVLICTHSLFYFSYIQFHLASSFLCYSMTSIVKIVVVCYLRAYSRCTPSLAELSLA
jgi:hypothetical protein